MTLLAEQQVKVPVLDHGFVQLLDVMGDDQAIVDAARTSVSGEQVTATSTNVGLIRYLMRHKHWTPFEMTEFKFLVKLPIFVARQWVRHRASNLNEMSARYSVLPSEFYVPNHEDIRYQDPANKQGGSDLVSDEVARCVRQNLTTDMHAAFQRYKAYLGLDNHALTFDTEEWGEVTGNGGVARETARMHLPLSTYTVWVWKSNLRNLFNFLSLRMDSHAQKEIRVYADAIAKMVARFCPIAWEAFEDYDRCAETFTRHELMRLRVLLAKYNGEGINVEPFPTRRESDEWRAKLRRLFDL